MTDLTEKQKQVIEKVRKLLALSGNNSNEHEAQSAAQLAMDLLSAYNLSMHQVGSKQEDRARKDNRKKGGLYQWQRDIWSAVSVLNFCMYFPIKGTQRGQSYEHRVIGSNVNVVSTEVMAEYLQQAIERLAKDYTKERGFKSVFVKEAIAYREGMATRIVARLNELRRQRDTKDATEKQGGNGTALVLADVMQTEADLNNDYIYGYEPGTTAARRAAEAERRAKIEADYAERMREHQRRLAEDADYAERARKAEAETDAWREKYYAKRDAAEKRRMRNADKPGYDSNGYKIQYRALTPREERAGLWSFRQGYSDGANVSLNQQVDESEAPKTIGGA